MNVLRVAVLIVLTGCGAKTMLNVGPGRDGGTDAEIDAPPPIPLSVDCGRSVQFTTPRLPLTLQATVMAEAGTESMGWELLDSPPGAIASLAPSSGLRAILTQDQQGLYIARFTARDRDGREASCDVQIESIVGPPRALCPEDELRTPSGVPILIEGDGFDDIGVVSYSWAVVRGPGPVMLSTPNAPVTQMTATVVGPYVLELTVIDGDGAANSCQITVLVVGPPMIMCPDTVRAPTRQPVDLIVIVTDDTRVRRVEWEVVSAPRRSTAEVIPGENEGEIWNATFTPDRQGEYLIRVTATDEDGLTASCEFIVIGLPTPPDAICPDVVETTPLTETTIEARAEDDGEIVRWRWELVELAPGSAARPPRPADEPVTRFTPDLAGEYRLQLTVTDDDGDTDSCTTLVRAIATEGLRIETFWDSTGTDMDLHLLDDGGRAWRTNSDCYYVNCIPNGPNWGRAGADDDPHLDIDDVDGLGPENINIDDPQPGTYRVGVYAYSGSGNVTVRIYCGGSATEPVAVFGPRRIDGTSSRHDFWRVADVELAGTGCDVLTIDTVSRENHDGERFSR